MRRGRRRRYARHARRSAWRAGTTGALPPDTEACWTRAAADQRASLRKATCLTKSLLYQHLTKPTGSRRCFRSEPDRWKSAISAMQPAVDETAMGAIAKAPWNDGRFSIRRRRWSGMRRASLDRAVIIGAACRITVVYVIATASPTAGRQVLATVFGDPGTEVLTDRRWMSGKLGLNESSEFCRPSVNIYIALTVI